MAYTLEQIQILENAIATGSKVVKYGDKEVEYRSLTEMKQTLDMMKEDLGLTDRKKDTRRYGSFNKGLE